MASLFVDTNVFFRFLTNDDPVKAQARRVNVSRCPTRQSEISDQSAGHCRNYLVVGIFLQAGEV
jgi:hypothetical protein